MIWAKYERENILLRKNVNKIRISKDLSRTKERILVKLNKVKILAFKSKMATKLYKFDN